MSAQKLKLTAAMVLLGGAAGLLAQRLTHQPAAPPGWEMVCISTGKTFYCKREEVIMIPWRNPETHELTLLPCKREDGRLRVLERYRSALDSFGEMNRVVDVQTLMVRAAR